MSRLPPLLRALAAHLGPAYLRYSFTKGTDQEVAFLVDALASARHAGARRRLRTGPPRPALAERGLEVVGVDISVRFSSWPATGAPARPPSSRRRPASWPSTAEFDAAISLCQGGFGLVPGEDGEVLRRLVAAP